MPIYEYRCINGHIKELFCHVSDEKYVQTLTCEECANTMGPIISNTSALLWFEEGRPRTIYNLGHEPITIRSHKEHQEAMKKAGVTLAGNKMGERGCWI